MKTKLTLAQQIGLTMMSLSMLIYYWVPQSQNTLNGWSLINYALAVAYFFISFFDKPANSNIFRLVRPRMNWHILLSLLLVSCFTLNKDVHVFAKAPLWLELGLIPLLIAFVLTAYPNALQNYMRKVLWFLSGVLFLIILYYSIVLLPTMLLAVFGLILLGISIHLAVPMIILITQLRYVLAGKSPNRMPGWFWTGFLSAVLVVGIYIGLFAYQSEKITSAQGDIILNENLELPEWVQYAQKCESSFWARRVIGLGLLYEKFSDDWWGFDFNRGSFSEIRVHDPLVALAGARVGDLNLSKEEKVKILSTSADTRHYAYEKLWSGRDLRINKKITDMRVYPAYRLAYSEQTFWIENTHHNEWSQQEALLTFYLPEGAVASSLSLWINGKEEQSRLTTRKKAATAYRQVVGVESRDPVVLHWQEGNRLTATIFPCTPAEPRRVKVGITIPMAVDNGSLVLENMQMAGPDNSGATEMVHLKIVGDSERPKVPSGFKLKAANQYLYSGRPLNSWQVKIPLQPLSKKHFAFSNQSYCLETLTGETNFNPSAIYLDVNSQWTLEEMELFLLSAQDRPVYVYTDRFQQLELASLDSIYQQLARCTFSVFPVHKLSNASGALLITKGQKNAPIPSELTGSEFYDDLTASLRHYQQPIACLVVDGMKSDYIASLEQYKLLNCQVLTTRQAKERSIESWYKCYPESENAVILANSEMMIVKSPIASAQAVDTGAPSHLLRLYNYHAIIQQAGHLFLNNADEIGDNIYELCDEAFVVSPISSLIVLETLQDYERFDIDESTNSLKNASLKDSGAVPEPHEWALIAVVLAVITLMYFKFKL
ncbi:XrtN system VIT domain-containing protein [Carboxylicivirga mesophila]|uniref:XrtN system VIT domain-containing protein n=1 Tax=Carboxylicivirga mesophila TaxID=1166478 RepID=A0ABS5KB87_9BACT|nr:XrtN system VIT domain-containing protein [Carboxylicivirga mesophila]MBS2212209.1 XrtN system VIT domain-containing protein [Carboxylicivirga mesophila]